MLAIKQWMLGPRVESCVFCRLCLDKSEPFHYEDEKYLVITDIKLASAQAHLLVITKQHIRNALEVKDPAMIAEMHEIGQKVLSEMCQRKGWQPKFRFGFHLPPYNSVDHIHLHCFIEPLTSWSQNKLQYGWMFHSVEEVLGKMRSRI